MFGAAPRRDLGIAPGVVSQPILRRAVQNLSLERHRVTLAWLITVLGLPLCAAGLSQIRNRVRFETELLVFIALVVVVAALGGRVVGAAAAIGASLLLNWYFVEPLHTFSISDSQNIVAVGAFLTVALMVSSLVDVASRRGREAHRARGEGEALARAAAMLAADPQPLPGLAELLRQTFGFAAVGIEEHTQAGMTVIALAGNSGQDPSAPTSSMPIGVNGRYHVRLSGHRPSPDDQRVLHALLDQLSVALEAKDLAREAGEIEKLTAMDAIRTALLRAVSHDLRTPLSSIKAMVSGLLDPTVVWTPDQTTEALKLVEEETDRLNRLVGNLLDASRLQIGALAVSFADTDLGDVIERCVQSLGRLGQPVAVSLAANLPLIWADGVLLERSLANIVTNAIRYGGPTPPRIVATHVDDRVRICVIDHGPGIAPDVRAKVMLPFQRLGDHHGGTDGVGLGMSIAQGFVNAMGGVLLLDDTLGGGLTVTVVLDTAAIHEPEVQS